MSTEMKLKTIGKCIYAFIQLLQSFSVNNGYQIEMKAIGEATGVAK